MAELSKAIARLMEERERTQPQAAAVADPPKLRDVLELARGKLAPAERPLLESFTRRLFEKAGADVLDSGAAPELAAVAVSGCRFLLDRNLEEPRVRVFDPDLTNHGWEASCTVVESVMRDRPFIIDTIRDGLRESGCGVRRMLHPVLAVERDPRGTVLAIHAAGALGRKESFVHVEIDRVPDPEQLAQLLRERLGDVVLATDDYAAMRARAESVADELRARPLPPPWNADIDEVAAFLDWLGQKSFVFLGYREYQFAGHGAERTGVLRRRSGLGVLRKEERSTFATPRPLPEALRRRLSEPPLLIVSKTNALSTIHRRAPMDYIGIKEIDAAGIVVGERRFLGLFTSKAYAEEPTTVPLLRRKLAAILEAEGATEDSHDYKAIVTLFNSMPKVELLGTSVSELRVTIKTIRAAEGTPGSSTNAVKVVHCSDALSRGLFVVVILPRERFSQELFRRVEARLAQVLSASGLLEERLALDDSDQVRMHFYFAAPAESARVSQEELCEEVSGLLRTWDDRLRDTLREHFPREHARLLADRYIAAFSNEYKAATEVGHALQDIRCLEALLETRSPQVDLTNDVAVSPGDDEARYTAVKLYLAGERLVLSDFLPVLEHLGLKVFAEDPLGVMLPQLGRGSTSMHSPRCCGRRCWRCTPAGPKTIASTR
jgi:glutamate dehydrogenase